MSRQLILGTAGHIDHGKTALIRALTGIDTDRLPQEKERGITIDIGFAYLHVGEYHLGIVDVPGHERFIKNMLAGAAGIDLALLVVAADDSVMPQTREHLAILELLQVRHGLIALTKTDLGEPDWIDLVEEDVRELVSGTFLERAPIVRTSATAGTGLGDLTAALADVCSRIETGAAGDLFRMAVDRSFVVQGLGTIVTGTVWSGRAAVGDEVEWLPVRKKLRVRGLQSHGKGADHVIRGQRAAVNLQGVHHTEIQRGHEIATPGLLKPARRLTVRLNVLPECPRPLSHRARLRLHIGTQEVMAGVRLLGCDAIGPGGTGFAQLICAQPVIAMARQPLVIRSESPLLTLGGGIVLLPTDRRITRRDAASIERLEALQSDDDLTRTQAAIYFAHAEPWTELDLCREADVSPSRAAELIDELKAQGLLLELPVGPRGVLRLHRDRFNELRDRIVKLMARLHEASPLETAIPRQRIAGRLPYLDKEIVLGLIDRLIADRVLTGDENAAALADFKPSLTAAQIQLHTKVIEAYQSAGFSAPDAGAIAKAHGVKEDEVRPLIELAAGQGHLVHLGGGLYMHAQWEAALRDRITDGLKDGGEMTVAQIRDLLNITRKHAVPICEYLDRIGLTKRKGDYRVLA